MRALGLDWQFASRAEFFLRWAPWRSISKMCFTPTSIPTASRSRWSSPVVGLTGWSSRFPFSTWTGSPKVWFVKPLLPLWTRWFLSYALLLPYSFPSHYLTCAKNMGKRLNLLHHYFLVSMNLRDWKRKNLSRTIWNRYWSPWSTWKPSIPTRIPKQLSSMRHYVRNQVRFSYELSINLYIYIKGFPCHAGNSQGLGVETAEKQPPSALEYAAQFGMAVEALRKSGKSMTQNQMLAKCISDYNEKVVVKRWKIDSKKRKFIQNLLKCSSHFLDILAKHYDQHRHASSGAQPTLAEFYVLVRVSSKHSLPLPFAATSLLLLCCSVKGNRISLMTRKSNHISWWQICQW